MKKILYFAVLIVLINGYYDDDHITTKEEIA